MWAEGWGRGERGKNRGVGSSYLARDQSGWRFATKSKKLALQVGGFLLLFLQAVQLLTAFILCRYRLTVRCVNINELLCAG
jgi:hypothetical protein